jgi:hypothetical protein
MDQTDANDAVDMWVKMTKRRRYIMNEGIQLTMEQKIANIHTLIKNTFGEAAFVSIEVNCEGIKIEPRYMSKPPYCSMKNIRGEWIE